MKKIGLYFLLYFILISLFVSELFYFSYSRYSSINLIDSPYLILAILGIIVLIINLLLLVYLKYNANYFAIAKNLQKSEERFLLSTEGSGVGIWDWVPGSEDVYYSKYFKKLLGYTEEEFPNTITSFNNVIHPDDHDPLWEHVRQHVENNIPFKTEYRLRTKSGQYRWFRAAGKSQRDGKNISTRMLGAIIDIDDMKRIEERLEIQNSITHVLSNENSLEHAASEIIRCLCNILRWELGNLWIYNNTDNRLHCTAMWQIESMQTEPFKSETTHRAFKPNEGFPGIIWSAKEPIWLSDINDGSMVRGKSATAIGLHTGVGFPILLENEALGVIELFTKKTLDSDPYLLKTLMAIGPQIGQFIQRRATEKELNLSNEYNTAILESANDCIITIDETGQLLSFNLQTLTTFHYSASELKNKMIDILITDWRDNNKTLFNNATAEFNAIKKNGYRFPVEMKLSKMRLDNKRILVIFIRDITDRKKIENIKNEFISVVSHELRTPLTSIRGSLGLILGGAAGDCTTKMKKLLEIANTNSERLLMLINDILDIEKIEAGKMHFSNEIIDVSKLIHKSILMNKPFANKFGIQLRLIEKSSDLKINADPDRLMQVFTNLLSNAVKYSFPNETVNITLDKVKEGVQFSITNKGPGIPEEFHSKIFQKFSQANSSDIRNIGGTGLGLHITKSIVEKMGGTIHFVSQPNEETTFFVEFPNYNQLINSKKEIISELANTPNKPISNLYQERLLVCEDDNEQALFFRTLLESAGFTIDIANSVANAKKLLNEHTYHALLLDLILPDQDGITFIRELRQDKNTLYLPIIVMSAIAQTGKQILNGDAFSVLDWLDKPVDFSKLLNIIKKIKNQNNELNILHIEDDFDTTVIVKDILGNYAKVDAVGNVHDALSAIKNKKYNLVILDLVLPDGKGIDLIPLFSKYHIPVIVYSAYELDEQYAKLVNQALIKSKTSNQQFLDSIKSILESTTSQI